MHEKRNTKQKNDEKTPQGAVPAYLLDREGQSRAKVLSNMIKQKRKEKAVSSKKLVFIFVVVVQENYLNSYLRFLVSSVKWKNKVQLLPLFRC